jgi:hypothetical protein
MFSAIVNMAIENKSDNDAAARFQEMTKKAHVCLNDSVHTLLVDLSWECVSQDILEELCNLHHQGKYVPLLERAQQLVEPRLHTSTDLGDLLVNSWTYLHQYTTLQHRGAHRCYQGLRQQRVFGIELEQALQKKILFAEQCCASQRGIATTRTWAKSPSPVQMKPTVIVSEKLALDSTKPTNLVSAFALKKPSLLNWYNAVKSTSLAKDSDKFSSIPEFITVQQQVPIVARTA